MHVGCDPFVGSLCLCAVYGPTTNPSGVLLRLAACHGSFVWGLGVFLNEGSRILDVVEALYDDKIMAC